jgi:FlaA1/EpsC-like NDP-sugar epimerase
MGEPVRIGDLADRLLAVAASYGAPRVPVETIGLRPGEKRTEQLTTHGLAMRRTDHPRIWVAREAPPVPGSCAAGLRLLRRHVAHDDALGVLSMLERTVGDFKASAQAWAIARAERLYRTPRGQRAARTA